MKKLSVIIPTCNRNEMLGLCLERLAPGKQTLPVVDYEVIVTDDSYGEGAEFFCKLHFPFVRYNRGPRKGPAANRNNGARYAKGDWLVFTDDDCLPDANWLQAYADAIHQYPELKAFEGAILPDDWNLLNKDMAECPVNDKGGCFWSANIAVEKILFDKLHGFDEQFKIAAMEDKELFDRVRLQTSVVFLSNASVVHPVRIMSLSKKIKDIPRRLNNWFVFEKKDKKNSDILIKGINFQGRSFIKNFVEFKFKQSTYNLMVMLLLFPCLIFNQFKKA
jgi:GT2 family glycosyltransferase